MHKIGPRSCQGKSASNSQDVFYLNILSIYDEYARVNTSPSRGAPTEAMVVIFNGNEDDNEPYTT